jgi:hypothetical protein
LLFLWEPVWLKLLLEGMQSQESSQEITIS